MLAPPHAKGESGVTSAMILCRVGEVNAQTYIRQRINEMIEIMDFIEVYMEQRRNDTARGLKHVCEKLG